MKSMFFTFLMGVLLSSNLSFAGENLPEKAAACPYKTKACENPFDSGAHCGALTLANAKTVLNSGSSARTR